MAVAAVGASYELRLPLQYDRYLPYSARSLAMGNSDAFPGGPLAVFGFSDHISEVNCWGVTASAAVLSAGRSHVILETGRTTSYPAALAVGARIRSHRLSFGYRQAMEDEIAFPDIYQPLFYDCARMILEQFAGGWSYSTSGRASLGLAVSYYQAIFDWFGPEGDELCRRGRARGYGFAAGISIPVTTDLRLSLAIATKSELKGTADFVPDPATQDLKLSGAVPGKTRISLDYRLDDDLTLVAEAVLTGWNVVTTSYQGKPDLCLGGEYRWLKFLSLRLGAFTLLSPQDDLERSLDPSLQDMYFLSLGAGLSSGGFRLDLAGATSRTLSGRGQNQNRLAATIAYEK